MARFKIVSASLEFHSGIIGISPQQVADRIHNLKALGSGKFEVVHPVVFKRGEEVEVEGEPSKAFMARVEQIGGKAKAAPKPAAPAAAKKK